MTISMWGNYDFDVDGEPAQIKFRAIKSMKGMSLYMNGQKIEPEPGGPDNRRNAFGAKVDLFGRRQACPQWPVLGLGGRRRRVQARPVDIVVHIIGKLRREAIRALHVGGQIRCQLQHRPFR